ncbi:hypothetical protein TrCOL_g13724 [Triparma columacea]|uniref:Uncharacterized protein n=1 Tax=Triparma columacea TaxID=722753 RepID=A0A9W7L2J8_9STRA|nr:hypothetical protein TrCOL_g13724 [Triparma columacea]
MPSPPHINAITLLLVLAYNVNAEPKVMGLGFGRTGTDSMKRAFIELGFGPSYHMSEVLFEEQGISTEGHNALWQAGANGETVDWASMLKDFNSGGDFPLGAFPKEMRDAFPEAKFVLTTRPSEKWWSSIQSSICWMDVRKTWPLQILTKLPFFPFSRIRAQQPMIDAMIKHKVGAGLGLDSWNSFCDPANKEQTIKAYEAHNARVKALIPPERLLVFETGKSTYADLAAFVGAPTPVSPYPSVNSKEEFANITMGLTVAATAVLLAPLLLIGCLLRCWSRRGGAGKKAKGA